MNDRSSRRDELVVDERRLAPRPTQNTAVARLLFGLLYALVIAIPIALVVVYQKSGAFEGGAGLNLIRLWLFGLTFLLVWSIVFIKREPLLARCAIGLFVLFFAYLGIRVSHFTFTTRTPEK